MVTHHVFLRSETFSHTMFGAPWINFEWLSQITLYLLFKIGGLRMLWLAKTFLCLSVTALTIGFLIRMRARGPWLWLLVCVGFLALKPRLYDRVELISLLFFPLLINILASLTSKPFLTRRQTPWVVGGIMVLWVNLHGGFLYGLILIGSFCVGARWSRQSEDVVAVIDRSFVAALAATLLNPYGPYVMTVFVDHWMQIESGTSFIQEWAMPTVYQAPFFWALFVVTFFVLIDGFLKKNKTVQFWTVAVFLFAFWGTRSIRNTAYAAALIPFFIADALRSRPHFQWNRWGWIVSFALLLCLAKHEFAKPWPTKVVQENRFPFGACRFLKERRLNGTLYNSYHFGGAIEWMLGHDTPVFMDGRYLFQPLLVDHAQLDGELMRDPTPDNWQRFLSAYGVDIAVSEYGPLENIPSQGRSPFSYASANLMFPRTSWALVYWDDAALVFLKRGPRFDQAIKDLEYTTVWPYNLSQMNMLIQAGKIDGNALAADLKRNSSEVPRSYVRQQIENMRMGATHHVG